MRADPETGCWLTGASGDVPSIGCLGQVITSVINVLFVFLGLVTIVFLIWGSIKYILSRGDQKAVQTAQKTITHALLGAGLVLGAYILINLVTTTFGLPSLLDNFRIFQP